MSPHRRNQIDRIVMDYLPERSVEHLQHLHTANPQTSQYIALTKIYRNVWDGAIPAPDFIRGYEGQAIEGIASCFEPGQYVLPNALRVVEGSTFSILCHEPPFHPDLQVTLVGDLIDDVYREDRNLVTACRGVLPISVWLAGWRYTGVDTDPRVPPLILTCYVPSALGRVPTYGRSPLQTLVDDLGFLGDAPLVAGRGIPRLVSIPLGFVDQPSIGLPEDEADWAADHRDQVQVLLELARADKEQEFRELGAMVGVTGDQLDELWTGTRKRVRKERQ